MLKKKGDISMQVLVLAVIALIVLVVIIMIFTSQATKRTSDYEKLATGAMKSKCETVFGDRKCAPEKTIDKELYKPVDPPSGGTWPFCKEPNKCWELKSEK